MNEFVSNYEEYIHGTGKKKAKNKQIGVGELGEKGGNPVTTRGESWRIAGELGRKLGEFAYHSPRYPVEALGPLAELCETISTNAQLNPALVGQSILAAGSLITQGQYEVETLSGYKPLSIFCLTIAESGDGKSTAESIILKGVRDFEKNKHDNYERLPDDEKMGAREPYLLSADATVQGIIKGFKTGSPTQGIFTAEGATMLCGWGMSGEQRANTSANLNKLWDGEPVSVQRGMAGRIQLYNRRFCAHWLIQPGIANNALNDQALSGIGLWPRFMISWPEALAPRKYKKYQYWHDPIVINFWERCKSILNDQDTAVSITISY